MNWFYEKRNGIRTYNIEEDDNVNYSNAEKYIAQISHANGEIICASSSYREENSSYYSILKKENDILKLFDKRDYIYDRANEYFDALINNEDRKRNEASIKLVEWACEKDNTLNKEDGVDLDKVFKSHMFFNEDEDKYFENIKTKIISKYYKIDDFENVFYNYKNSAINIDIYIGFQNVLDVYFNYIKYNDEKEYFGESLPIKRTSLNWMREVNNGKVYAIPFPLVKNILNKESDLFTEFMYIKNRLVSLNVCGEGLKKYEQSQKDIETLDKRLVPYKVFNHEVDYLKEREDFKSPDNSNSLDNEKMVLSDVDLTSILEFGLDIPEIKKECMELINYFNLELKSAPEFFENSEQISEYLDKDIKIDKLEME